FAGSQGYLDFLKPIDKALLAKYQGEAAGLQGEINTLKKRLENKIRELGQEVKNAERNQTNNLAFLQEYEQLVEGYIEESDDWVSLEGSQSAASANLKVAKSIEAHQQAVKQLQQVKTEVKTLLTRFDNIESYLEQLPKTALAKKQWQAFKKKYLITEQVAKEKEAQLAEKAAKNHKQSAHFGKAVNSLQTSVEAYRDAENCCNKHVASVKAQWHADELARAQAKAAKAAKAANVKRLVGKMVSIPSGSFKMGSQDGDDAELPIRTVRVESFKMMANEVTVGQFKKFVNATGYRTDAEKNTGGVQGCYSVGYMNHKSDDKLDYYAWASWRNPGFEQSNNEPVVCISYNDAVAYAKWISQQTGLRFSLPSEAQWEYAARGGSTGKWHWGNRESDQCDFANGADETSWEGASYTNKAACKDGYFFTAPVGLFQANGFGLYDMSGNAWEWTKDCWNSSYSGASSTAKARTSGSCGTRVLRGGGWFNIPAVLRSAYRGRPGRALRSANVGVRLIQDK
ncbi:MAG: SUMF1/EgtB/PvdO family nonheme iron enzyme, partial [Colwellia sp.]